MFPIIVKFKVIDKYQLNQIILLQDKYFILDRYNFKNKNRYNFYVRVVAILELYFSLNQSLRKILRVVLNILGHTYP